MARTLAEVVCGVNYVLAVGVALSIVNNNPETMERTGRSFPTAAGWFSRLKRLSSRPTLATARGEPRPITTGGDHGSPLAGSPRCGRRGVPLAGTTGWLHVGFVRPKGSARAPQDEDGRARAEVRLIAEPFVGVPAHDVKQPISFPRRMSAPGFCILASLTPNRGVGGAPRNVRVRARHP